MREGTIRNLIAILRGIHPTEAVEVGASVLDAGFGMVEVPLNSPTPLDSIACLSDTLGCRGQVGAGTVLEPSQVRDVVDAGAKFVVSPNFNPLVVQEAQHAGIDCYPGVFTATECLSALDAGVTTLKIFPAEIMGPVGIRALRAVLPPGVRIIAVGGAGPSNFSEWAAAGADGFGIGSFLYSPGRTVFEVHARAAECVAAYDASSNLPSTAGIRP